MMYFGNFGPIDHPLLSVVDNVEIFGIWFKAYISEPSHYDLNYKKIIDKMEASAKDWSNRSLTVKGRITVMNTLIISLACHVTANTHCPNRVLSEIKRITLYVVWKGKKSKVAYESIIQAIKDRGLKLVDYEVCLKTQIGWIKRLNNHNNSFSSMYLCNLLGSQTSRLYSNQYAPNTCEGLTGMPSTENSGHCGDIFTTTNQPMRER